MLIDTTNTVANSLAVIAKQLEAIADAQVSINHKLGVIMSEDASIQAVTADIQAQVSNITTVMSQVSSTLATALSEIGGSSTNSVTPQTVTDLKNAQAQLDAAVAAAQQQATTEAGQVPPPPAPPAQPSA